MLRDPTRRRNKNETKLACISGKQLRIISMKGICSRLVFFKTQSVFKHALHISIIVKELTFLLFNSQLDGYEMERGFLS